MGTSMKVVVISNALYHHQIPFSLEMENLVGIGNFYFIATSPPGEEQLKLGYQDGNREYPFVITTYNHDNQEEIVNLVEDADLVIWGGAPHLIALSMVKKRIKQNKIIFRYSERIFKKGMWRAFTPARIAYMLFLHTRFRKKPIYMLCASAYLPYELDLFKAYPNKMFRWGYFPPLIEYDIKQLMEKKQNSVIKLLWVGRFIDWKHPEVVLEVCRLLMNEGFIFHCDIIGRGKLEGLLRTKIDEYKLSEYVSICGAMSPEKVRGKMEEANILLSTSDFHEGWGAVINEAMNSGCTVIASHAIGSVPILIKHRINGMVYKNGDTIDLYHKIIELILNEKLQYHIGIAAYSTIVDKWNATVAASSLISLFDSISSNNSITSFKKDGPCSKTEVISQRNYYKF